MSKPHYMPNCQFRGCFNPKLSTVAHATQYMYDGTRTWHVCAACLHKLAIAAGLEPDPKLNKKPRKKRDAA